MGSAPSWRRPGKSPSRAGRSPCDKYVGHFVDITMDCAHGSRYEAIDTLAPGRRPFMQKQASLGLLARPQSAHPQCRADRPRRLRIRHIWPPPSSRADNRINTLVHSGVRSRDQVLPSVLSESSAGPESLCRLARASAHGSILKSMELSHHAPSRTGSAPLRGAGAGPANLSQNP